MKVILTTNIKKLGKVGDQVIVKDGFARNFLFPNKMALRDTKNNLLKFVKRYLSTAPNAPPVATNIKLNNILKLEVVPLLLQ